MRFSVTFRNVATLNELAGYQRTECWPARKEKTHMMPTFNHLPRYTSMMRAVCRLSVTCLNLLVLCTSLAAEPLGYKIIFVPAGGSNQPDLAVTPNVDYYSVLISSVFLDRDDRFLTKNNIAVVATLTVDGKDLTIPVYAKHDPGVKGLLGIHNFSLLTAIPATGTITQIGIDIRRRNLDDPVKKVLDFAANSDNDTLLKTYAANAVPFVSLFGGLAKGLYSTFGTQADGEILFSSEKITLAQGDAVAPDAYRLRDATFLVYKNTMTLVDTALHLDNSGNVIYHDTAGDQPLQGFPYVAIRIQKFAKRQDFANRDWYSRYETAYQQILNGDGNDFKDADKTSNDARVLLFADKDFTLAQKASEASDWKTTLEKAKMAAQAGRTHELVTALESARQPLASLQSGENAVTTRRVISAPGTHSTMTLDIQKLKRAVANIP
jgi:hypothetical protein